MVFKGSFILYWNSSSINNS